MNANQVHPAKAELVLRRITQRTAASHIGISATFLSRVLNGAATPSPRIVVGLTTLLDKPADELFDAEIVRRCRNCSHTATCNRSGR